MRWRSVTMGTVAALAAAVLVGGGVPALAAPAPATTQVQTAAAATPVAASAPAPTYTNPVSSPGSSTRSPIPRSSAARTARGTRTALRTRSSTARGRRASGCCRSCGRPTWSRGRTSATCSRPISRSRPTGLTTRGHGRPTSATSTASTTSRTRSRTAVSPCSPHRRRSGPWTDRGLIVGSAPVAGCPTGNIDQALFTDSDGTHYFYWGSYDVICVSEMNADATALTGEVTQVAQGRRMEGGFVVQRDGWYYLCTRTPDAATARSAATP